MYTTTEINLCPFSNKHSAKLMSPIYRWVDDLSTQLFRATTTYQQSQAFESLMATRVGPPCEGSEKTQQRTLIGQIKYHAPTSHPVTHIRPFS
ncbi:hypothetical protein TNCV_4380781 [Trichonephila clavipes]|nr:hypothetical protein TNCV_4380781 [Trichonephila clavipes]